MATRAIILAAGKGTRMRCDLPKVLHTVAGRTLVEWTIISLQAAGVDEITVVVGHEAELVAASLPDGVHTVHQTDQKGTGHAVMVALDEMGDVDADVVLVVPGDTPLLRPATLSGLVSSVADGDGDAALLTAILEDPTGYGRVIRTGNRVTTIVEQPDLDHGQDAIKEVAVSTYAFGGAALREALGQIGTANAQGEYYLTDVIEVLAGRVVPVAASGAAEVAGINSHDQLAAVESNARAVINRRLMEEGVWLQDPERTYVDATASVAAGARLFAGVHVLGDSEIGADSHIGPDVFLADSTVGGGSRVWYSVVRGAEIGDRVEVGPYASLRPGTVLMAESKAGTFVETKATVVGRGSKVPHLSYMGDAMIGEGSNIGAGTITCNYDGYRKSQTLIGDGVFVGSDTMLVAPVELGDRAVTGAGSVITKNVEPGALAVERAAQKSIPGYADRRARQAEVEDD